FFRPGQRGSQSAVGSDLTKPPSSDPVKEELNRLENASRLGSGHGRVLTRTFYFLTKETAKDWKGLRVTVKPERDRKKTKNIKHMQLADKKRERDSERWRVPKKN
ncbi:hypothetical protein FCV25MIE_25142, partial [Fagus crenata]